jgi:argininosuccinate lyase
MSNSKNSQKSSRKLWGGRFQKSSAKIMEKISASIQYDFRLYQQDIKGSLAHAKMLRKINILTQKELNQIIRELKKIEKEIKEGQFEFKANYEDIHMNIEAELIKRIGETGQKLHTGRSRNDQIALDTKIYIRDESLIIKKYLIKLIKILLDLAEKNIDIILPGYTHLQVAQPVRLSHYFLAYAWKLRRDLKRLDGVRDASNSLPLGVGALAGVNYKNDRAFLQKELDFKEISYNSMDTVSERDYVLDFLYFASVLGMHLSRFCEELVLWSTAEFDYIKLSDEVTTGSSIMPQKRNPDIAELIRGKTGRLYGNLVSLLTTLKGLPLTYNRDLQEDKEPLFDSVETVKISLEGMLAMLSNLKINKSRMEEAIYSNFSTATDLADYLVEKGVPFRKSHGIIGSLVLACEKESKNFFNLPLEFLKQFSPVFDKDVFKVLNPKTSPDRKKSKGGTAKKEILNQIKELKKILN